MVSVRIFSINYYLSKPEPEFDQIYSDFRCDEIKQVPVIQIFGTTNDGRKVCLHVHNVFPYLYIRSNQTEQALDKFMNDLARNIDKVLNVSMGQRDTCPTQHVYKIEKIDAIPMYGYYHKEYTFLKIYLYNPDLIKRLSDLLINGAIMNESFQPYYSHIPYNLQFLIDFNLFGMNFVNLEKCKYRQKHEEMMQLYEIAPTKWDLDDVDDEDLLNNQRFARQSICDIEIDCCASDITNAKKITDDDEGLNPGLDALWEDEKKRRKTKSLPEDIEPPESQEREHIIYDEREANLRNRLIELLEKRFDSKYPFKKSNDDSLQLNSTALHQLIPDDVEELSDENILNILDSLHEESDDEEENEDYDSVLVQQTQLNDEEKERLLEENEEMSQQIESLEAKNADEVVDTENFEILNETAISDSSDDEKPEEIIKKSNIEDIEDTVNPLEYNDEIISPIKEQKKDDNKTESLINLISVDSDDNSNDTIILGDMQSNDDDGIIFDTPPKPMLSPTRRKPVRQSGVKYKGVKRLMVKLTRLDDCELRSHFCRYFETEEKGMCQHKSTMNQNICLNCDFSKDHVDSLEHMALLSPVKSDTKVVNQPIFDSPTKDKDIIDETIVSQDDESSSTLVNNQNNNSDDDDDTLMDETSSLSSATISLNDSDSLTCSEFEEDFKDHETEKCKKLEMSRRKALSQVAATKRETTEQKDNSKQEIFEEDSGTWFCPTVALPNETDLKGNKSIPANDTIVCYSNNSTKKWKLNVPEFETLYKVKRNVKLSNDDDETETWFTPAIPFPSFDRVKIKTEKKKTQKRLLRIESESQYSTILFNDDSSSVTLNQVETLSNLDSNSLASSLDAMYNDIEQLQKNVKETLGGQASMKAQKSILTQAKEKKSKRKSVRFTDDDSETSVKIRNVDDSSNDSNTNSTVSSNLDEKLNQTHNNEMSICDETLSKLNESEFNLDSSSASFYEYNSMLFPKCTKFIDSLIETQDQDATTTMIEVQKSDIQNDFKVNKNPIEKSLASNDCSYLTVLSLELHVNTSGNLQPNPDVDSIGFICYTVYKQRPDEVHFDLRENYSNHLIIYDTQKRSMASKRFICPMSQRFYESIQYVYKEEELFSCFIKEIHKYDPDILVGFEIQKVSWCFLAKRALNLGIKDFCSAISRLPKSAKESGLGLSKKKKGDVHQYQLPTNINVAGRIVLNLWRVLRSEVSLNIYTFENCCYHILHERTPKYSYPLLKSWFQHRTDLLRWRVIKYYMFRCESNIRMMNRIDLLGKTSEFARVYGIEFYHVLSRGSQYRVESMMLRIAKKLNFIAVSPSLQQKSKMRAPETIPLTLEPESNFYVDPIAILDFQSLYPSVIIAFNICFTTCLGRIESIGKEGCFKFGCTSLFIPDELIKKLDLEKDIYIAPNGVAYVAAHIRKGVLPIMLEDILKTRVMVKNSMKLYKSDENLLKVLDSRQLSLKLIANVTFGYTAANYTGRMPCSEVGDTIYRQSRTILENSIKHINSNYHKYGGRVVYGDTDSMFVLFRNMPKNKAFESCYKIVEDISSTYKKPIKLKFEKIYLPSVLIAKKRYVGYSFETPQQLEPVLDAKGIEVVRRDGCQVSSKMLERCLKVLFEFKDVDKVRNYVYRQCTKLVQGKTSLKDFIIAKEYRGRDTYSNVKSIAACQIANRNLSKDPLAEPLTGERVPYLICYGPPGLPLYDLVRSPEEFMQNGDLKINYEYYVMKQILPPLDRVMSLLKVNVFEWVNHLSFKPKIFHKIAAMGSNNSPQASTSHKSVFRGLTTLTQYFFTVDCMLCGMKLNTKEQKSNEKHQGLCDKCSNLDENTIIKLKLKFKRNEKRYHELIKTCQSCTSNIEYGNDKLQCMSLDCPNMYLSNTIQQDFSKFDYLRKIIDECF